MHKIPSPQTRQTPTGAASAHPIRPKIAFRAVTKIYKVKRKPVTAVENITINIPEKSFTALVGASGSGKSTILNLISGIERPTEGKIAIDGKIITDLSAQKLALLRRRKIGIIFQQFYLEPNLTLRQNIELPAMFAGVPTKARALRTEKLTTLLGLDQHLDHLPCQLSGGQIQRTAIARALYNHPEIILADEPTSGLDQENLRRILKLLARIRASLGATIIIATHDPQIARLATHVITLQDGKTISQSKASAHPASRISSHSHTPAQPANNRPPAPTSSSRRRIIS